MTCAACHTGQVEFGGAKYLIDGAPTMGDFEKLFHDLVKAMQATLDDDVHTLAEHRGRLSIEAL